MKSARMAHVKERLLHKSVALYLIIVLAVAITVTVISGLFDSLFVIGQQSPTVTYLGFPIAWSGLPYGIYAYKIDALVQYAISAIGFVVDIAFYIGIIIIFTIALRYLGRKEYEAV